MVSLAHGFSGSWCIWLMVSLHMQLPVIVSSERFVTVMTLVLAYLEVDQIHVSFELVHVTGSRADGARHELGTPRVRSCSSCEEGSRGVARVLRVVWHVCCTWCGTCTARVVMCNEMNCTCGFCSMFSQFLRLSLIYLKS